jgi:predicted tellurium resistance membrane protein TerC
MGGETALLGFTTAQFALLGEVIMINFVLSGDNAVVVGMAAAGVAREQRRKVIFWGIAAAVVMRIVFAGLTTQLLAIIGLKLLVLLKGFALGVINRKNNIRPCL